MSLNKGSLSIVWPRIQKAPPIPTPTSSLLYSQSAWGLILTKRLFSPVEYQNKRFFIIVVMVSQKRLKKLNGKMGKKDLIIGDAK